MLQLRRQATSNRTRSPWSELTFTSNFSGHQTGCRIVARSKKLFFQRFMQYDQEDSGPLERSS